MHQSTIIAIVTGILGLLGGGAGVWTFITKRAELRANREEKDLERAAAREEKEIDRLRQDVAEGKKAHAACEEKLAELDRRMETMEHHHGSYLARWITDGGKRIVWVNSPALIEIFAQLSLSRIDVIGRTFSELLPDEAAREIDRLDRAALARPMQAAASLLTLHPSLPPMLVVKVAGPGRDGELIWEGYAFRPNDPVEADERGRRRQEEQRGASHVHLTGHGAAVAGAPVRD